MKKRGLKEMLKGAGAGLGGNTEESLDDHAEDERSTVLRLGDNSVAKDLLVGQASSGVSDLDEHTAEASLHAALAVPSVPRLKSALSIAAGAGLEHGSLVDAARAELERVEAEVLQDWAKAQEDAESSSPAEYATALFLAGAAVNQEQWDQGRARYLEMMEKAAAGASFFPFDHLKVDPNAFDEKLIPDELKAIASERGQRQRHVVDWRRSAVALRR